MNFLLLSLIPTLLFSSFNDANFKENNINNVIKETKQNNDPVSSIRFEKEIYFIQSENIIESDQQNITYETIKSFYESPNKLEIEVENQDICTFSFLNNDADKTYFSLKGLNSGNTNLLINKTYKIPIYVLNSYTNFKDDTIIKPTSSKNNPYKFDLKLVDGDDISGIHQDQINFEIIENLNNCIKQNIITTPLPYGIKLQTTNTMGQAKIKCSYTYKINNIFYEVDSFVITINVVDKDEYFNYFYEDEGGQLVEILDKKPLKVEPFSKISLYVGNLSDHFLPTDFEIKNHQEMGGIILCELNIDNTFGFPMLRLDIVTGEQNKTYRIEVGMKNNNISKTLLLESTTSRYSISINHKYIDTYYHVSNRPDFYKISLTNKDFIRLFDNNSKSSVLDITPIFSQIDNRLGKQRVYVTFNIDGEEKMHCFDIKITLDNDYNKTEAVISDTVKVSYYRYFLDFITNNRPSYYSALEAYNDLEYEYLYSLNDYIVNFLANDFNFIRLYRRFISSNNIEQSFFKEISVNLGMDRYVLPIVIICIVSGTLVIIFVSCLYYIKKRKGYEDD